MLDIVQFRQCIVQPALYAIDKYSAAAEELLVATCAQESLGCTFVKQKSGPAVGPYQMEPATFYDLFATTLARDKDTASKIKSEVMVIQPETMVYDFRFATQMARVFYMRIKEPLPDPKDLEAMWAYYKKYYNTPAGAAKKEEFFRNYKLFVRL